MSTSSEPSLPKNSTLVRSTLQFPVIGIGASAGGLKALLSLFEQMPSDCGMAFVVIMHLSPRHESNIDRILQNVTRMPVLQVTEPVLIERNHIYVIPPAMDLSMNDGYLRLVQPTRERGAQVAIDLFFRALADVHHTHAIGVVLSGSGADGSVGLARIKEQGGVTLAQLPADAEYDSMPSSAIETGMVDIVLPVAEMSQKLVELGAQPGATARTHPHARRNRTARRRTGSWRPAAGSTGPQAERAGPARDSRALARTNRPRLSPLQAGDRVAPHRTAHAGQCGAHHGELRAAAAGAI